VLKLYGRLYEVVFGNEFFYRVRVTSLHRSDTSIHHNPLFQYGGLVVSHGNPIYKKNSLKFLITIVFQESVNIASCKGRVKVVRGPCAQELLRFYCISLGPFLSLSFILCFLQ